MGEHVSEWVGLAGLVIIGRRGLCSVRWQSNQIQSCIESSTTSRLFHIEFSREATTVFQAKLPGRDSDVADTRDTV